MIRLPGIILQQRPINTTLRILKKARPMRFIAQQMPHGSSHSSQGQQALCMMAMAAE